MRFNKENILLNSPLYVGWWVLNGAKLHMFTLFYKILKPVYKDNLSLIYTDTDSFLFSLKNFDIMHEFSKEPLASLMDFSNFPKDHVLYDVSRKGQIGLLKSETGCNMIKESVCLAAKCYSLDLEKCKSKSAAKGISMHIQKEFES